MKLAIYVYYVLCTVFLLQTLSFEKRLHLSSLQRRTSAQILHNLFSILYQTYFARDYGIILCLFCVSSCAVVIFDLFFVNSLSPTKAMLKPS